MDRHPKVGNGWQGYALYSAGDVNSDRWADIYGIDPAGDLYLSLGLRSGGFATKVRVGWGWSGFDIASGADINGDRIDDLIGRDQAGQVFFYRGLGKGRFATKVRIGDGWGPAGSGQDCSLNQPGQTQAFPWQQPLIGSIVL
ncbi:MAG: VCBS repeat-containing protein [Bifidobacteriaceae bacterium]|nr:VCBS repeat-containing protein [Bifidobacteriaceae bacterium]